MVPFQNTPRLSKNPIKGVRTRVASTQQCSPHDYQHFTLLSRLSSTEYKKMAGNGIGQKTTPIKKPPNSDSKSPETADSLASKSAASSANCNNGTDEDGFTIVDRRRKRRPVCDLLYQLLLNQELVNGLSSVCFSCFWNSFSVLNDVQEQSYLQYVKIQ